jgi:hypothetical protein
LITAAGVSTQPLGLPSRFVKKENRRALDSDCPPLTGLQLLCNQGCADGNALAGHSFCPRAAPAVLIPWLSCATNSFDRALFSVLLLQHRRISGNQTSPGSVSYSANDAGFSRAFAARCGRARRMFLHERLQTLVFRSFSIPRAAHRDVAHLLSDLNLKQFHTIVMYEYS